MGQKDIGPAIPLPSIWDLCKGLVTNVPPSEIDPTACQACSNVIGYEGKLRPRPGMSSIFTALDTGYACYHFRKFVGFDGVVTYTSLGYNFGDNSVRFYEWNGTAWVNRTGAATPIGSWLLRAQSTNFKGALYFTTQVDGNLYKWAGPGNSITVVTNGDNTLAPFYLPKFLFSWMGRLWTANSNDASSGAGGGKPSPTMVAWSDLLIDNVWQGTASGGSSGFQLLVDGNDEGNDPITGGFIMGQNLIIGKFNSLSYFSNVGAPKYFDGQLMALGVGIASQNTVARYRDAVFFLGPDNVYVMQGLQEPVSISDSIHNRLRDLIDPVNSSYSCAVMDPVNQIYYLFLPLLGTNIFSKIFAFSIRDKSWWEGDIANGTIQPSMGYTLYESPFGARMIICSQVGGFYKLDNTVATDGGTKWATSWTSKRIDSMKFFNSQFMPTAPKFETVRYHKFGLHAESGSAKLSFKTGPNIDSLTSVDTRDIANKGILKFDGKSDKFLPLRCGDRFFEITLTHPDPTPGQAALVQGMTIHVTERGSVRTS